MQMWLIAGTGWLIFTLWAVLLVPTVLLLYRRTLWRKTAHLPKPPAWPKLSVIVPARNEERKIEAALRSLLASDYAELEIIAINDRSEDGTGAIMDRLAADDERLRVIHVESLPDGWLGKNHALQRAAEQASGEYLLFTDGDVLFAPDALRRAVSYARHVQADHLCLIPQMITGGYWEDALTACFGLVFVAGSLAWLVPTPFKRAYAGVGAFNLVRADSYRAAGSHKPIRLDVLDDVKLGKLMKRHGFRQDILVAGDFVQVKWQESAADVIRGLEKNGFAVVDYSLTKAALITGFSLTIFCLPYLVPPLLPDVRCLGYALTVGFLHLMYALIGRQFGGSWLICPALPVALLLLHWALWRSAWITLRQGGVCWRDTFYPLDQLRPGLYR